MRKKILEKKLLRYTEKRDALKAKALASEDVNEVRSINGQIEEINEEISDIQAEIAAIADEEARSANPVPPQTAQAHNAGISASFVNNPAPTQARENVAPSIIC